MPKPILEVRHLYKIFRQGWFKKGVIEAVKDINFAIGDFQRSREMDFVIPEGGVFGIVGESGCGKTTLLSLISGIYPPSRGDIRFGGRSFRELSRKERAQWVGIVFQNPEGALDPAMRIKSIVEEPLRIHGIKNAETAAEELLIKVKIPEEKWDKFPRELSVGEKQRVSLARAVALRPKILLADEPFSSVDAAIRYHLIMLFEEMRKEFGFTLIVVSHDLKLIAYLTDIIAVMLSGLFIEWGKTEEIIKNPVHPYTSLLVKVAIEGFSPPEFEEELFVTRGCPFYYRCPYKKEVCKNEIPAWKDISPMHKVRCMLDI